MTDQESKTIKHLEIESVASPGMTAILVETLQVYGGPRAEVPTSASLYSRLMRLADAITRQVETGAIELDRAAVDGLALGDGTPLRRVLDDLVVTNEGVTLVFTTEGEYILSAVLGTVHQKPGPKTHATQLTRILNDGTKAVIDTRNLSGAVLSTPERAARSCLYWLDVYRDPEIPPEQKTKMRMNLERADALWGRELEQENPGLYLRVMQALGHPEKAALNPILALDNMEEGF